jgi:hypothetical protein
MIDSIYQLLKTIVNKELRGNVSPAEFNLIAKQVQEEIFRGYFEDENRDKNRRNRGLTNNGYSNLPFLQRQRLDLFSVVSAITENATSTSYLEYTLPSNLYNIKDKGLSLGYSYTVPQEVESSVINFVLGSSKMTPSVTFPIYEKVDNTIRVYPDEIPASYLLTDPVTPYNLNLRYIRKPLDPKWTYTIVSNTELFNNAAGDYQDFELHPSEYTNIVIRMLSYFGVNLREIDVARYAEAQKSEKDMKEEDIRPSGAKI